MRVIPDQDERDLATMCRSLLAAECPTSLARGRGVERITAGLWKALAGAGVLGLAIDEERGGSGGSLTDLGLFSIEAGRALCPIVVHSTMHAALAVDWLASPESQASRLPALASGRARGTTALWSARDASDLRPSLQARRDSGLLERERRRGLRRGRGSRRHHRRHCRRGGRTVVFVVDTTAAGIRVEPVPLMGGHPTFAVRFDDVAVDDAATVDEAQLRRTANAAVALDCLDLVGVGEAVIAMTVDYTKMREQFGRPIASFQAAQHLVADMHIALAAARLAARSAVSRIAQGHTATRETAVARMRAAEVKQITLEAHQLHGGMGYVVDTDLHLYSERARVLSTLGGGADIAAKWLQDEMDWGGGR